MVTFKDFRRLMDQRSITADELVYEFRGKIDDPRDFLTRVWQERYSDVVIPYRSVLKLFYREQALRDLARAAKRGLSQEVTDMDFSGSRTPEIVKEFSQQKGLRLPTPQHGR